MKIQGITHEVRIRKTATLIEYAVIPVLEETSISTPYRGGGSWVLEIEAGWLLSVFRGVIVREEKRKLVGKLKYPTINYVEMADLSEFNLAEFKEWMEKNIWAVLSFQVSLYEDGKVRFRPRISFYRRGRGVYRGFPFPYEEAKKDGRGYLPVLPLKNWADWDRGQAEEFVEKNLRPLKKEPVPWRGRAEAVLEIWTEVDTIHLRQVEFVYEGRSRGWNPKEEEIISFPLRSFPMWLRGNTPIFHTLVPYFKEWEYENPSC